MSFPKILLGAALTALSSLPLVAQQPAPSGYHYIQCIKVNPGQGAAAHEWITGTDHKVMQALVDSGVYAQGITLQTVMPAGTDAQCDYVFVFFYKGLPHSPITREELNAILRKADIPITAEAIREKHAQLAKLVYNNITQYHALVGGAKKGDYLAFNSIRAEDGNVNACVDAEKKMWQPVAEELVKAGKTSGWAVNTQVFPWGTKDGPAVSTVDIYPSYDAFISQGPSVVEAWKKAHPDSDIGTGIAPMNKMCPIEHNVLYEIVDSTTPAK